MGDRWYTIRIEKRKQKYDATNIVRTYNLYQFILECLSHRIKRAYVITKHEQSKRLNAASYKYSIKQRSAQKNKQTHKMKLSIYLRKIIQNSNALYAEYVNNVNVLACYGKTWRDSRMKLILPTCYICEYQIWVFLTVLISSFTVSILFYSIWYQIDMLNKYYNNINQIVRW